MRRSIPRWTVAACALPILFALGCGGAGKEEPAGTGLDESASSEARQLFVAENCTLCHGEMTQGVEELGPAIRDLAPYWDRDRLAAYLEDPQGFREANPDFEERRDASFSMEMPPVDHLSVEQRLLLADWLLTR